MKVWFQAVPGLQMLNAPPSPAANWRGELTPASSWECWVFRAAESPSLTWSEQDDGHGDEGADHQDDQQSDGDAFPVPLRWTHPAQVLQTEHRSGQTPVET